jgi:SNF family Na+-dependent transporter
MTPPARSRTTTGLVLTGVYLFLATAGLVGTWYFNLVFIGSNSTMSYVEAWFANPASSSAAVDVAVTAVAANVFFVREGIRLGFGKWSWVLIPLTYLLALAFTFPLFLALRELRLSHRAADGATAPLS